MDFLINGGHFFILEKICKTFLFNEILASHKFLEDLNSSFLHGLCALVKISTTRGSLWIYWHLPSPTKTKDLFINLKFNYFKVFTVGVQSFFRPLQPRPEQRKKVNFWKEPQRRSYTIINFPLSQNCHSLSAWAHFWKQGRIASG